MLKAGECDVIATFELHASQIPRNEWLWDDSGTFHLGDFCFVIIYEINIEDCQKKKKNPN